MSENSATNMVPPAVRICQAVGVCIFILSYFLPVLPESKPGAMGHIDATLGYECAKAAFLLGIGGPPFMGILVLMSDLVNLLVPAYLLLSFSEARSKLRNKVMILTSFCMIATWIVFAIFQTFPLIGHFLWLGGALLIIVPQWRIDQSASEENPAG